MKKINILLAATCALTLAACSQSDDLAQDNTLNTAQENLPVAFDTYVAGNSTATTRSTYEGKGLFETGHLEGTYTAASGEDPEVRTGGFGIFAYTHSESNKIKTTGESGLSTPDFMLNQQVVKDGGNWKYDPLKYWPNMTSATGTEGGRTDSQTGNTSTADERHYVSFFAYAPYQAPLSGNAGWDNSNGTIYYDKDGVKTVKTYGITSLPIESTTGYPKIHYVMNPTAAESQDLLFGVAPMGGIGYRAVNGTWISKGQGMGLEGMLKPSTHTQMKFLFLHALTALKMNIAAAIDEVSPGSNTLDAATKVYVKSITLTPVEAVSPATSWSIASDGDLNLNPATAWIPKWESTTTASNLNIGTAVGTDGVNVKINTKLQSGGTGVTTKKRDVFTDHGSDADADDANETLDPLMFIPVYTGVYNRKINVTIDYDVVTTDAAIDDGKVTTNNVVTKSVLLKSFKAGRIYNLSIVLGLTSVKVDAEGEDWSEEEKVIDLPRNLE